MRLSKKEFWENAFRVQNKKRSFTGNMHVKAKRIIKKIIGKNLIEYARDYNDYVLWEILYKKYLVRSKGKKIIEIGSAPGNYLIRMSEVFGFIPYGVEYSKNGVEINKKNFTVHGLNPNNIIHADFFSKKFQDKYRSHFDIVVSRGFIEHFSDINNVIQKHLDLLKEDGYLIVSIPNFRGIYYLWIQLFRRSVIEWHNFEIMKMKYFEKVFTRSDLTKLYCNYYGVIDLKMCFAPVGSPLRIITFFFSIIQKILNISLRFFFKNGGPECSFFSPFILYFGIKGKSR